jgi:hypothetical protein
VAVSEKQRHELFTRAEAVLGKEEAATMMELIGPAQWSELATKADLTSAVSGLRSESQSSDLSLRADLRAEMQAMGADLRAEMQAMGADLRNEMQAMGADLRNEIHAVHIGVEQMGSRLTRTFVTWLLASQGAFAAMVALLVTLAS